MTTATYDPGTYHDGDEFYNGVPARSLSAPEFAALTSASPVAIATSSVADPTYVVTSAPHLLTTGDIVTISGHTGSTPALNGRYMVRVVDTTTFWVPVPITVGGTGGTVLKESQQALLTASDIYTVA